MGTIIACVVTAVGGLVSLVALVTNIEMSSLKKAKMMVDVLKTGKEAGLSNGELHSFRSKTVSVLGQANTGLNGKHVKCKGWSLSILGGASILAGLIGFFFLGNGVNARG
jgi:hypothetical protein